MSKIQLNVKLNRAIYSEEEFEEMQRLMSAYALVTSKRSGKIFLVLSKYSKASLHWSDIAFSLLWFALIMPIPISKWICFPLATVATVIMIAGLSALRKRYRKKCQSHPLMVLDPQKKTIAFYRFKSFSFFQMSGRFKEFKFSDIVKTQLQYTYRIMNPDGKDVSIYSQCCLFSIFTQDSEGNPVQNMIFATYDAWSICKKIADLLKEYGNIPIDVQRGSGMDQYR